MNVQLNTGLFGEYRLVIKRNEQIVQDTGWFKNLILNSGLDFLGTNEPENVGLATGYQWCKVGTGSTAPAVTQTALVAQIAEANNFGPVVKTGPDSPNYIMQNTVFYQFEIGEIVATIAEIGVGWTSGVGSLFSRALILDESGNPSPITLTSIDQLQVYYRLNFVPFTTDFPGSFVIGTTTYNYTGRHAMIGAFDPFVIPRSFNGYLSLARAYGTDFELGPITGLPTGTSLGLSSSKTVGSYTNGNYYLDITYTWEPDNGVGVGGIKGLDFDMTGGNYFQIELVNPIPKTNTQRLTLTIRNSWARI